MGWLVFMGWVISQANEWEEYSNYFGEGAEIFRNWTTTRFLAFYGRHQNCHGSCGCVIQLMYYNEHIMRLKVYWKSNLLPSWTQLVLTSLCLSKWLSHSLSVVICSLPSYFSLLPFSCFSLLRYAYNRLPFPLWFLKTSHFLPSNHSIYLFLHPSILIYQKFYPYSKPFSAFVECA